LVAHPRSAALVSARPSERDPLGGRALAGALLGAPRSPALLGGRRGRPPWLGPRRIPAASALATILFLLAFILVPPPPGGACGEAARPPLALRRAAATAPSGGLGLEPACAFHLEPSWHQGSKALTHSLRPWSWNAQEKLERVRSYLVLCVPPRA
jgi:hypothetical protein